MKVGQYWQGQGQKLESSRTRDEGRTISSGRRTKIGGPRAPVHAMKVGQSHQGQGQKLEGSRTRDEGRTVYSGTSAKQGKITF